MPSLLLGKVTDGSAVLAVVVNMLVGFVQEMKASQAIATLNRMLPENATVIRDGAQR